MSDLNPAAPAPAAEPTTAVEPTPEPIHPVWEAALAPVADSLRGPLYEQIRRSDAEAKAAIEKARGEGISPEWRDLATQASGAGLSASELVDAYNATSAIREDPVAFLDSYTEFVNAEIAAGRLTRAEGQQAKAAAAEAVSDATDDLQTPDQLRIAELQQRLEAQEGRLTAREQAELAQAEMVEAREYANNFLAETERQMQAAGYGEASVETQVAVMRIADSLLTSDTSDTLTPAAAITHAVNQLRALAAPPAPAAPAPVKNAARPALVGGGSASLAAPEQQKLNTQAERRAAMLEEGRRQLALGD